MSPLGKKLMILSVLVLAILSAEGFIGSRAADTNDEPRQAGVQYGVRNVIDGDTVVLYKAGEEETIRLIGIDTPETAYTDGGAECFNEEATAEAKRLLEGGTVTVVQDPTQDERDTYGRLLGYLELPNGTDFGAQMLEGGYAREYTFRGRSYERQATYTAIAAEAEASNVGLWSCE